MSKSQSFRHDLLQKVFINTEFPWLPRPNFYAALHTDNPGMDGNQTTKECKYTGYERIAIMRKSASWNIKNNEITNNNLIQFPVCIGMEDEETATYLSIGIEKKEAGMIIYSSIMTLAVIIRLNIRPEFPKGSIKIKEI